MTSEIDSATIVGQGHDDPEPPPFSIRGRIRRILRDRFVLFLLAMTFANGMLWAAVIPLWQTPDEPAHFYAAQSLGERALFFPDPYFSREFAIVQRLTGLFDVEYHNDVIQPFAGRSELGPRERAVTTLPTSLRTEADPTVTNPAAYYPPGYYLLLSLPYRALKAQDVLTIASVLRILSAFLTAITVAVTYVTLKRFFTDGASARATAMIVALSPMYVFTGMAVNVEVLVWLLFSLYIYLLTIAFTEGLTVKRSVLLALTASLGLWSKQTFVIAIPLYFVLLGFVVLKKRQRLSRVAAHAVTFLGILAALAGWLYFSDLIRTTAAYPGGAVSRQPSLLGFLRHFGDRLTDYRWTFDSFWGNFGWLDTPLSFQLYTVVRWMSAIAALGLLFYMIRSAIRRDTSGLTLFYFSLAIAFVGLFAVVNYVRIETGEGWFLQGRYFFPIYGILIALLVQGTTWFLHSRVVRHLVLLTLVLGMFSFHLLVLTRYILPRYYL
jgi:4-amino-4-deoxy-L-arabinose transferase-like glycosyltransferase